jgi:hypothetical protein
MNTKLNFQFPKYRKYQNISTPDGDGEIIAITYTAGGHWYTVELIINKVLKVYAERELSNVGEHL